MSQPSPLLFVIQIAGAAALLLWSVRLVRTGVERGWSVQLRRWLRRGGENRMLAAGAGTIAAIVLQSSTAVALLTANFVTAETLAVPAALAVLLGADVGSAIVAQILLTRADWLVPVLLVAGVAIFQRSRTRNWRMAGRVLIGLALIFVSLGMIRQATEPLRDAAGIVEALHYLGGDPITAFVIGALFAWAVHSSVAAVLLFVTLAQSGVLPVPAGVAMVLGANLGGALIAFLLTLGAGLGARRVVTANLLIRGGSALALLLALTIIRPGFEMLGPTPARQVVNLHLFFNLALLLVALPLTGPISALAARIIRPPATPQKLTRATALDPSALARPDRALSAATREILILGEGVEAMLRALPALLANWSDDAADAVRVKQTEIGQMHLAIKLYLARLQRAALGEGDEHRAHDLADMAVNLETAANVIAQTLLPLAQKLDKEGLRFSDGGRTEIADFHDRVLSNARAALDLLITLNPDAARALVEEKDNVRDIEQQLQRSHLDRLRDGRSESIETSNLHQETLRALKQVNAAFTQIAYPILRETGDLLASRLNSAPTRAGGVS